MTDQNEPTIDGRRLPKLIEVTQKGTDPDKQFSLRIDGVEFPWWISSDGISTRIADNELPTITVQILAEQVIVNNDWRQ